MTSSPSAPKQRPWHIADGPDSQIGQHDEVREEPTLGSPRPLDDADGDGKELRDAVMALSRRVAALEKKMGQQAPGRMASQAASCTRMIGMAALSMKFLAVKSRATMPQFGHRSSRNTLVLPSLFFRRPLAWPLNPRECSTKKKKTRDPGSSAPHLPKPGRRGPTALVHAWSATPCLNR
jgi:hypothetical protein